MFFNKKNSGFSLIEMSIVIIITAIVASASLKVVSIVIESSQETSTRTKLDELNAAVVSFVKVNGILPCPADITLAPDNANFGVSGTNCNANIAGDIALASFSLRVGMVPVRTLGLPDSYAFDSWNNRIRYGTIKELTLSSSSFTNFLTNFTGLSPNTRTFEIRDAAGNTTNPANIYTTPTQNLSIAYLLLSHGQNANGAVPYAGGAAPACPASVLLDQENCNGDAIFRDALFSTSTSNYYDDLIRFKTYNQLRFDAGLRVNTAVVTNSPDTLQVAFNYDGATALTRLVGVNAVFNSQLDTSWVQRTYNTVIKNFAVNPATVTGPITVSSLVAGTYYVEVSSYFFTPVDVDVGIRIQTTVGNIGERVFRAQAGRSYYLTTSGVYTSTASSGVTCNVRLSATQDVRFVNNLSLGGVTTWPYYVMTIVRLK